MDVLEFQESEVMFSDYSSESDHEKDDHDHHHKFQSNMMLKRRKSHDKKIISSSLPIHIPNGNNNSFWYDCDDDQVKSEPFDHVDDHDDDEMMRLPPHLIVERRRARKDIARSFPLKGKNLYHIRNCTFVRIGVGL
ncbi:unnamed protein product [Amaranthus hypochondriacus]